MLERDVAQHRGDVFPLVRRVFEQLIQIVPAHRRDQLRYLSDPVVQGGDRFGQEIVGFILKPMNLMQVRVELGILLFLLEERDGLRDLLALCQDDFPELPRELGRARVPATCWNAPIQPATATVPSEPTGDRPDYLAQETDACFPDCD